MKSESLENRGYGGEMATTRLEHDALADVQVPADRLWGAQTQRSLEYFAIGVDRFRFTRPVIRALGLVKIAAATANNELGKLRGDIANPIIHAAREVAGLAARYELEPVLGPDARYLTRVVGRRAIGE